MYVCIQPTLLNIRVAEDIFVTFLISTKQADSAISGESRWMKGKK